MAAARKGRRYSRGASLGNSAVDGAEGNRAEGNETRLLSNTEGMSESELIERLQLDLKLKDADNRFLQEEISKLQAQIDNKDKILILLTDGLKEVVNYVCFFLCKALHSQKIIVRLRRVRLS